MDFDSLELAALRRRLGEKWTTYPDDVLAAWVADMDFPVAEPLRRLFAGMLEHTDFGYPVNPTVRDLPAVFAQRMQSRFGWSVDPERVEVLTDVVQGLYLAILTSSEPGDALITPVPIYPPFLAALRDTRRVPVWQRYERSGARYGVDLDRLRAELHERTRLLLICNPHNPTGHVLSREELEALAQIALEHDLVVVSDEIHSDLVFRGARHVPFAALDPEVARRTITLTSATKAFTIAGLRVALAAFGSAELQQRFNSIHPHVRGGLNTIGLNATRVAWLECQDWQDRVLAYLEANRDFVAAHVQRAWPEIGHVPPAATYLAWLDCRALRLEPNPFRFFLERGRVALSDGARFGESGQGFVRLNFATSRAILTQVLERMGKAIESAARAQR
jgi:cystathionine beta-lyase